MLKLYIQADNEMRVYKIFEIGDIVEFNVDWFPAKKSDEGSIISQEQLKKGIIYCIELTKAKKKIYLHNSESWIINKK